MNNKNVEEVLNKFGEGEDKMNELYVMMEVMGMME